MGIPWKIFCLIIACVINHSNAALYRTIELRSGAFVPVTDIFRDIHGDAGVFIGAQAGGAIRELRENIGLEVWGDFDWFDKRGFSIGFCSPTRVQIANFSTGVNFTFACSHDRILLYTGLGPCIGGVWVQDETIGPECRCVKNGYIAGGFVLKTGFYAFPKYYDESIFVKFFADLVVEWAHFCTPFTHQVGGLQLGIAAGIRY